MRPQTTTKIFLPQPQHKEILTFGHILILILILWQTTTTLAPTRTIQKQTTTTTVNLKEIVSRRPRPRSKLSKQGDMRILVLQM